MNQKNLEKYQNSKENPGSYFEKKSEIFINVRKGRKKQVNFVEGFFFYLRQFWNRL